MKNSSQRKVFLVGMILLALSPRLAVAETSQLGLGYRHMYNLEFDEAHRCFQQWGQRYPQDPLAPVSDAAAYLFAELDRMRVLQWELFVHDEQFVTRQKMSPDPTLKQHFETALVLSQRLADQVLAHEPHDENALFANILRLGLHADYLALIEQSYLRSLGEMKAGRQLAERLLIKDPSYYDAYLAIGVENYLLSLRPAPIRWMLRITGAQTDKELGIQKLRVTAENGRYLKPYARLLLAVAALRDKDWNHAKELLRGLAAEFPRNQLYFEELARLQ